MKPQIIHKGKHRPRWWFLKKRIWINKKSISRYVWFYGSCIYDLKNDDQADVNKLFGLGYFWNVKESARFGWNFNPTTGKVDVFSYLHLKGVVQFEKICSISIGEWVLMILNISDRSYSFSVTNNLGQELGAVTVPKPHKKKFAISLGLYFGGTWPAPHDMKFIIQKNHL